MSYVCRLCPITYRTNDYSNWNKHIKTAKHINNASNLKQKRNKDKKVKDLEDELKTQKIKNLEEKNMVLEKLVSTLCEQALTKDKTINKSVSALTFLMTHRKKAPPLKELTVDGAKEILGYSENKPLIDRIIDCYKSKKLDIFIGDAIVKCYKKENPEEQSVWNTDVSRLTYLIKDLIGRKGESEWIMDKKGVKLSEYVIKPILDFLKSILREHINMLNKNIDKIDDIESRIETGKNMEIIANIIYLITCEQLEKDISKRVSAHFQLNKHAHID